MGIGQRLGDRTRELCAKAIFAPDAPEWTKILSKFRVAVGEHSRRMRMLITRTVTDSSGQD